MSKGKRAVYIVVDLVVMAVLVFIDRYTKELAAARLKDADPFKLIQGVFELRYLENRGAAFGMLQNQRTLFICVGAVFLVIIFFFLVRLPATKKYRLLRLCLVMLGAGAIGNLYDRITLNYVIDFLYFIYIDFPIFNVADIYVTVSAALLVILFLFIYKEEDLDMKKANTVKLHSSMVTPEKTEDETSGTDDGE
ncbi:MAG: signal peptidase II [Lachnospiraceae bacterium]|nr:signal peptidase II [Lachnospiraceae bacterium]